MAVTENFTGYFTDRAFNVLSIVSTHLPEGITLYNDKETEEIEAGGAVFDGEVAYSEESNAAVKVGNYFLFKNEDGQGRWYTIIETEKDRANKNISFSAEDGGLDLLNEVCPPWESPDTKQPIAYYVNKAIAGSGFEIGLNEIADLSRSLKWEGEATATERLLSICTQFDAAELSFDFEIDGFVVVKKYVNIKKKRGRDTELTLNLNRDISNIVTSEDISDLATALRVTGGTPEGQDDPITLTGYTYDNGDIYTDGIFLKSRSALQQWSRFVNDDNQDGHLTRGYSYDTTSQSELCNRAVSQLEKISKIVVNYQVDIAILPDDIRIGDTANIVDEEDGLYLNARILKFERSRSDDSATAMLGDYKLIDSGISQQLRDLADKIASIKAGDTYYPWVRYADDVQGNGISSMPLNKAYIAITYSLNNPIPSDNASDYAGLWTKIVGEQGKQGIQGPAGADGKATYMWIMYADDINGNGISDDATGKKYLGVAYNKDTKTPSITPGDYNWSAMYDNEKLQEIEAKLADIPITTVSMEAPTEPKNGDNWFAQDLEGNIIGFKIYDASTSQWVPRPFDQDMLIIKKLISVAVESATITGSVIRSTFDRPVVVGSPVKRRGYVSMENGYFTVEYTEYEGDKTRGSGKFVIHEQGFQGSLFNEAGELTEAFQLNQSGIYFNDAKNGEVGTLSAKSLVNNPWINCGINNGWTWINASTTNVYRPKTKKVYIQNSQAMRTSGALMKSSGTQAAGTVLFGKWNASDYNVNREIMVPAITRSGDGAAILFTTDGNIYARCSAPWSEIKWDGYVGLED